MALKRSQIVRRALNSTLCFPLQKKQQDVDDDETRVELRFLPSL